MHYCVSSSIARDLLAVGTYRGAMLTCHVAEHIAYSDTVCGQPS